jgi:hypothetical protein
VSDRITKLKEARDDDSQTEVGARPTSLASVTVALDALVVSTALSTIRLHDLSEAPAVNPEPDR